MDNVKQQISQLKSEIDKAIEQIKFNDIKLKINELEKVVQKPDFWQDNLAAQLVVKEKAKLEARIGPWEKLLKSMEDLADLGRLEDESLKTEIENEYSKVNEDFQSLKAELKYGGPYDENDAIISIYAGAGGTDAQDWAKMLLRMYVRWAEKEGYEVRTIDESAGEEAGIKSVTIEIDGQFIYGKLKGEHGVHRLVRLSPFNADHLRQTSFAKVEVLPKISQNEELDLSDKDLKIDVYRSGGHGGQSVNTTDSAVRVTHIPTGIVINIQNERSQLQNREIALTILRSKLAQLKIEQHEEQLSKLKGPNQSAEWGNQIRSYVLHPYKQVKDLRTSYEVSDPNSVLDGGINDFINAYLESQLAADNFKN